MSFVMLTNHHTNETKGFNHIIRLPVENIRYALKQLNVYVCACTCLYVS